VSNYAGPDHRSRHNCAYWSGRPYAGLGPSAHRFDGVSRSWNVDPWAEYETSLTAGKDPTAGSETLSPEQRRIERVYLALRTSEGLSHTHASSLNQEVLERAIGAGWMASTSRHPAARSPLPAPGSSLPASRLSLNPSGWLRLDELVMALTTSGEGG
jgi:oxygen-independent coproporphyrinogen-3 oxidase